MTAPNEVLPGLGILRPADGLIDAYLPDPNPRAPHSWVGTFGNRDDAITYLQWIAERSTR